jgi:hypothetical protein
MVLACQHELRFSTNCSQVELLDPLAHVAWQFVRILAKNRDLVKALEIAGEQLSTATLSPDQCELAWKRLANAETYLQRGELGAACYELTQLANSVCHILQRLR